MKFVVYLCLAFGAVTSLAAQETLTLSQCLQMAVDNNLSLQKSRNEMAKGKITISENQAKLLPQICYSCTKTCIKDWSFLPISTILFLNIIFVVPTISSP